MPKLSPHRLKGKIIRIRRGLALYQTYASPFYFARILDARNQRYKVRSTKETNRVEARKVADEYAHQITNRDAPAKEFGFKTYANRLIQTGRQLGRVRRAQQELYPHHAIFPGQRQLGLAPSLWNTGCPRPHHPRLAALYREALTQTLRPLLFDPQHADGDVPQCAESRA